MAQNYDLQNTGPEVQEILDQVMPNKTDIEQEVLDRQKGDNNLQEQINTINAKIGEQGGGSETINGRLDTLEEAVGTGGSVDERIAAAEEQILGGASENYNTLGKVEGELEDTYRKDETYTKQEVNDLITTPDVIYVSVVATNLTTAVTDVLPATGSADTIYRVGNWDGSAYDPTMYSLYTWNGSAYVCLAVRSFVGEVYDVSVNHPDGQGNPTPYADLAAALGTNGSNIPADIRRGGMSIKFIQGSAQSSDNKYVQYRLMSNSFSTTLSDWQGVDDEPTAGSENLVKSSGIVDFCSSIVGGILKTSIPSLAKLVKYSFITLGKGKYKIIVTPNSAAATLAANIYYHQGSLIGSLSNQSNAIEFEVSNEIETIDYYRGSSDTANNDVVIQVQNLNLDKITQYITHTDNVPTVGSDNFVKSDGIAKYVSSIVGGILKTNIPSISKRVKYPFITLGKGLYKITVTPNSETDILSVNIYSQQDTLIGTLTNQSNFIEFEITNETETLSYYRGSSDTVNNNSTILIQNRTDATLETNVKSLENAIGSIDKSGNFNTVAGVTVQVPILVDIPANANFYIEVTGLSGIVVGDYFKLWGYADKDDSTHLEIDFIPINNEVRCSFPVAIQKLEIVKAHALIIESSSFTYTVNYDKLKDIEERIDTNTFYVNGENGADTNDGRTSATAFKTFAKAVEMMANREKSVLHIAKGTYKEQLNISSLKGSVSIYGQTNEEVIISGSEVITGWEAVSGYQGIYKALFDDTIPVHGGHNLNRGVIYEVRRSSGLIDTSERHPSQKGLSYRLPFTAIQQCLAQTLDAALSDISENGGWYIDGGYIYIKNVDGSNPETNSYSYEYEKNGTFYSSANIDHLYISNISFRYTTSVVFRALFTERYNCSVIGCPNDGFIDNAYRLRSYFDECSFCGNDGANGHFNSVTNWNNYPLRNSGEIVEYYYAWMHDNFDDGLSHHEASHIRVIGGLYEYNGDGGIRVSNTSNTEVFSTYFRKNGQDNSSASAKGSGIDCVNTALTGDTRNGCNTIVYDCVSEDNKIGYGCLNTNNIITLINCISSNNSVAELYVNAGKVITKNCKYIQPEISKVKVVENNGEILVNNYSDFA